MNYSSKPSYYYLMKKHKINPYIGSFNIRLIIINFFLAINNYTISLKKTNLILFNIYSAFIRIK